MQRLGSNGNKDNVEVEVKAKMCPFLKELCTDSVMARCTIGAELIHAKIGRTPQKLNICAVNAVMMMLSEINNKTQVPNEIIQLPPGLVRG